MRINGSAVRQIRVRRKEITASRTAANGHRRIFQSRRGGHDRNGNVPGLRA